MVCHSHLLLPQSPFSVGLIKPMATDNPPCPPYPQTHKHRTEVEVELLPPQTTQKRHPICHGSHPAHGPSTTSVPKGLLLLPFSKGFRLDVRQHTIPSFLQGSTLAVEYIAHVIGRCCC